MKGKFFSRLIALVLALAMGFNTPVASASVEVKVVKGGSIKHASICKCPYCSLSFKQRSGKFFPEGVKVSKKELTKVGSVTYRGKKLPTSKWSVNPKTIKWKKGDKATITLKKGRTEKKVSVKVDRIMRICIKQTKLISVEQGKNFPKQTFKKNSTIMVERKHSGVKTFNNYDLSAKIVKNQWKVEVSWTSAGKTIKDTIFIPINKLSVSPTMAPTANPSASPTVQPSDLPSVAPSISPTASPSASPSTLPSAQPSNSPSVAPSQCPPIIIIVPTPTVSSSASPTVQPSDSPTMAPSVSPTISPSTSPTNSPTTSPSASPSTSPTISPTTSPTVSPVPEKKFFTGTITGGKIANYTGGEVTSENKVSEGTYVEIEAIIPEGRYLDHWADDKGHIVSTKVIFGFYVKDNFSYHAVFTDIDEKKEPILRLSGSLLLPQELTVRLYWGIDIPEGFKKEEWGYVYTNQPLNEDSLVVGGNVFTVINEATTTTGSAEWTNNISFSQGAWEAGTLVKFRSYAKVTNPDGKEEIVYSPIFDITLSLTAKTRSLKNASHNSNSITGFSKKVIRIPAE